MFIIIEISIIYTLYMYALLCSIPTYHLSPFPNPNFPSRLTSRQAKPHEQGPIFTPDLKNKNKE